MSTSALRVQESLQPSEWLAVALAAAGTIGLGATTEEAPKGSAVSVVRAVAVVSVLVVALGEVLHHICLGAETGSKFTLNTFVGRKLLADLAARYAGAGSALRLARRQRRRARGAAPTPARTTAYMYGLQAGACFGLSAACCRTGFLMAARQPLCVPIGLAASVGLTSGGFALQTCGLKDGNSLVVGPPCTIAMVLLKVEAQMRAPRTGRCVPADSCEHGPDIADSNRASPTGVHSSSSDIDGQRRGSRHPRPR